MDVFAYDLAALSAALEAGSVTSHDATQSYIDRIDAHGDALNAFILRDFDAALHQAGESDARRRDGRALGPLDGVPLGIKDNIDVRGLVTTAGMDTRREARALDDAPVTAALRDAGAVLLGKLNMDSAALNATGDNPHFGRIENPHKAGHTPGGSSSGSAAAVAAGLCAGALGSDTLGSVRLPAAYCGIAGHKPTHGLVSIRGVVPVAPPFDQVGPMARGVRGLGLLLDAMAGFDAACAESRPAPAIATYDPGDAPDAGGMVVGRLADVDDIEIEAPVRAAFANAADVLRDLGCPVRDMSLGGYDLDRGRLAGLMVAVGHASSFHAADLRERAEQLSPLLRGALEFGRDAEVGRLVWAERKVAELIVCLRTAFEGVDVLVLPTTLEAAFSFDQRAPDAQADFTAIASMAGLPAVSVPMGVSDDGLPLGLQIVGRAFADADVLRVARAFERAIALDLCPARFS
jgi:aspartyl-tRNA(Asn)/glutamyl-tRNA(Gln) amidotransferase subunit A